MTREEKVQYWLDIADEDLEVAEDLYKSKRWLYVAFMCHQVHREDFEGILVQHPRRRASIRP